ncbi:MAG: FAD/NAD(P)-binding protein [Gammaproteobacteria bacterium]|nr:FAD/NAD(P)-binding protein [Gammaproteobacteria bacterium]
MRDIYLPFDAEVIERTQESADIFTLKLQFSDSHANERYHFLPGQFNMLYLFGVGEVAISIVSDPEHDSFHTHTIRNVGHVTRGLSLLKVGDHVGIRGPFGQGWPLEKAKGKDVLIVTGGLGCAPSVSIIRYIMKRRNEFGKLIILQGVKHSSDLIFLKQYDEWRKVPDTQVLLAADVSAPNWPGYTGLITTLIDKININADNTICMMCGPEAMMRASVDCLRKLNLGTDVIYSSLERNMECAVGHCGHCQFGGKFICKDGPVFCYSDIEYLIDKKGF